MDMALITQLEVLRADLKRKGEQVIQNHPNWQGANWQGPTDTRVAFFNRNDHLLTHLYLEFVFEEKCLKSHEWWDTTFIKLGPLPDANIQYEISQFENYIAVGFIQQHFSLIDAAFRAFFRPLFQHVTPMPCNKGAGSFSCIYQKVFAEIQLAQQQQKQYENLIDFWSRIRNVIHNHGVYVSRSEQDYSYQYRGKQYLFEHKKGVNFMAWSLLFGLVEDIHQVVTDVVQTNKIATLPVIDDLLALSFPGLSVAYLRA